MAARSEAWRPGSFTKNFSWGEHSAGLSELYNIIRLGFDGEMKDVPREVFRRRAGKGRPDFIPINFFLFNKPIKDVDYIIADELVFQALNSVHSVNFDKLALFAFNFSFVGKWSGAADAQRRPALWANEYIKKRVAGEFGWDARKVSADDIERFVSTDARYRGKTSRKIAAKLNYLYSVGRLSEMPTEKIERWWGDAFFLALDRLIEHRKLDRGLTSESQYLSLLSQFDFLILTGGRSLEKELALKHLARLYGAFGGRNRFSEDGIKSQTSNLPPEVERLILNDEEPRGAIHPTNPRILKKILSFCAALAKCAGFDLIRLDENDNFNVEEYVHNKTRVALDDLRSDNIRPIMTREKLMKLTREK